MRAGVVFPDILAFHASASRALALVLVVFANDGIQVPFQRDRILVKEEVGRMPAVHDFRTQKIHQLLGFIPQANHETVVHATVVLDAVQVGRFPASGKDVVPSLGIVHGNKLLREVCHLFLCPIPVTDMAALKLCLDFTIGQDIRETENQFFRVASKLVTDVSDFFQKLVRTYLVGQDQRVEPPNHRPFAKHVDQHLEGLYALF